MTDTVLVLAWVVFAHLLADFVLQNDWIAINKGTGGRTGWSALAVHGFHVGLCLVPFAFAYGLNAIAYIAVVVASHVAVDRWKVRATRRAERNALEAAIRRRPAAGDAAASGLGAAWSPWPGMLFVADQVLHITIAVVGWLVLLEGVPLQPAFVDVVNLVLGSWDLAAVHAVVLTGVVLVSLFVVNTRAAFYFVLALVSPRQLPEPVAAAADGAVEAVAAGYTVRVGPLVATVEPGVRGGVAAADGSPSPPGGSPPARAAGAAVDAASGAVDAARGAVDAATPGPTGPAPRVRSSVPSGAPAMIGATIGALERLLIVAFVLTGAEAAVGFVIAAKTIARFRQLDDRGFAEYYLLGTLGSVSVALATALVAQAALATLG